MNDDQIKKLLKSDHSSPSRPTNEWPEILNKIETKKRGFRFYPQVASAVFVLTAVVISLSVIPNFSYTSDSELAEYMFTESYFEEEDEVGVYQIL